MRIRQPCARESWRRSENHIHEKNPAEFAVERVTLRFEVYIFDETFTDLFVENVSVYG